MGKRVLKESPAVHIAVKSEAIAVLIVLPMMWRHANLLAASKE